MSFFQDDSSRGNEAPSKKGGNSSDQQFDIIKRGSKTIQSTLRRWAKSSHQKGHDDDDIPKIPKRQTIPKPPAPAPITTPQITHTVNLNEISSITTRKDDESDNNAVIVSSNTRSVITI